MTFTVESESGTYRATIPHTETHHYAAGEGHQGYYAGTFTGRVA